MTYISNIKVPLSGPPDAKVLFIGEAPGETEELLLEPFVGVAGEILNLALAQNNIERSSIAITNLCPYKLAGNNFNYAKDTQQLKDGINDIQDYIRNNKKLKIIVLLGNEPLLYITSKAGIKKWRGTILNFPEYPLIYLLPTLNPAALIYDDSSFPLFSYDLSKINRILKNQIKIYNFKKVIDPRGMDLIAEIEDLVSIPEITVDIETVKGTNQILCCGFGYGNKAVCVVNHVYTGMTNEFEHACRKILENENIKKVFHNAIFDTEVFYLNGIDTVNISWDTMIAQHALEPELPKSLAHCISIYTDLPYHKDMGKEVIAENEKGWTNKVNKEKLYEYNCLDILSTILVKDEQVPLIKADSDIEHIFTHMMEFIPVSRHLSHSGMLQDTQRKDKLKDILVDIIIREQSIINTIVGTSINVNSPKQVKELLYSKYNLPIKYNKDVGSTKKETTDEDAIVELITNVKNSLMNAKTKEKQDEWKRKLVVLKLILTLRGRKKLLSSYIDTEISVDNRYRSSYNIAGTESGRLSASSYVDTTGNNAQTFPREVLEYDEKQK